MGTALPLGRTGSSGSERLIRALTARKCAGVLLGREQAVKRDVPALQRHAGSVVPGHHGPVPAPVPLTGPPRAAGSAGRPALLGACQRRDAARDAGRRGCADDGGALSRRSRPAHRQR